MSASTSVIRPDGFLRAGAEMAERMRAFDWSQTPLGPIERWPHSLRTAVSICLQSRQPMFIWWGDSLTMFYNDACSALLGAANHPASLGCSGKQRWPEMWSALGPKLEGVFANGEPIALEDVPLTLANTSGREETYCRLSCSPIFDDVGTVGGICCACDLQREQLITLIKQAPVGTYLVDADFRIQQVNPIALPVFGDIPGGVEGRDFAEIISLLWDEEHAQKTVGVFRRVLETGEPFHAPEVSVFRIDRQATEHYDWRVDRLRLADGRYGLVCYFRDISEQVRDRQRIAESERRLRFVLDSMPQKIFTATASGDVDYFNPQWMEFTGLSFDEIRGWGWKQFIHPDDVEENVRGWKGAVETGGPFQFEHRFRRADGEYRWHFSRAVAMRDGEGKVLMWVGSNTDIDDIKRANDELRQYRQRLTITLANSDTGTFRWDPRTGEFLEFDENLKKLFGFGSEEPVHSTNDFLTRVHPDDVPALLPAVEACRRGADFEMEYRVVLPGGEVRWLYDRAKMEYDAAGRPTYLVGACTDVTNRRRAEEELRASEARFSGIFNQVTGGIAQADLSGRFVLVNDTYCKIVGRSRQELLGLRMQDITHPDDLPRNMARFERLTAGGDDFVVEKRYIRPDGSIVWVSNNVAGIRDAAGQVHSLVAVVTDISQQVAAREKLAESEARFRTVTEAVPNLIWSDRPDGQCDWVSSQWRHYTGIAEQELLGLQWLQKVIHQDDRQHTLECWRKACADEADYDLEYRIRRHDGEYHWFKTRGVPIRDEQGKIVHWFGTCTDIEEAKRLEAALREADRRKDEFLATLAHELRNPLAPIRNSLHILRLAGSESGAAERVHEMMERQVNHLVRLVDDLMEVSRITRGKIALRKERVELAGVVRAAVETSKPLIEAAHHQLAIAMPADPIALDADPVRLAQVLANLLNNAAKYTEEGGQIWLTARIESGEAAISVGDNGVGIAPDVLPRVFDLFTQADRSVHRSQGGLGIGLTLVRNLVEMHGGSVYVKSDGLGCGSEFSVRLPLAGGDPTDTGDGRGTVPAAVAPRRVLVVDDNYDAAESLSMLLRFLGADVRTAHDGPSALEDLGVYQPSVVVLDIGMPGMDGFELSRRIRQRPEGRDCLLIALTGWGQEDDRRRSIEAGIDHHLLKPVDIHALQALLSPVGQAF